MVGRVPSRPLRILFFVREPPYVQRIYGPLVAQLTERGHEVELAFAERTRLRHADRTVALFSGNGVDLTGLQRKILRLLGMPKAYSG